MPPPPEIPPELAKGVPGAIGAVVALRWIAGSPLQRMASVIGGTASSYYGGQHVAAGLGVNQGLAGFLVGLFGMAVANKIFEALAALDIGQRLERLLTRWGL